MVSALTDIRSDIAGLLTTAGIRSQDYIDEVVQPPVAVVIPGDPYITPASTFGSYDVNVHILLIAGYGTNAVTAAALDELIETVIPALHGWDVTDIAQPGEVGLNGDSYLGTVIYLKTQITFS